MEKKIFHANEAAEGLVAGPQGFGFGRGNGQGLVRVKWSRSPRHGTQVRINPKWSSYKSQECPQGIACAGQDFAPSP